MRATLRLIFATVLAMTLIGGGRSVAAAPSKKLVFEGTVTSIGTIDHVRTPWLITVTVTKVISGEFSGSTFEFAVHSPSLAGLEKGHSYTIEAVWNGEGYTVDEHQWRRPKRLQSRIRSPEPSNPPLQTDRRVGRLAPSRAGR